MILLVTLVLLAAPADCAQPHDADRWQLLRRLSLDLRGRVPSIDEYEALDQLPDVPKETIAAWLKSDDFRASMRRYHEAMFWPNVTRSRLGDVNNMFTQLPGLPALFMTSPGRQKLYRNVSDNGCGDYEQTHFDPAYPGQSRPDPAFVQTTMVNGVAELQEGYRYVTPYWAHAQAGAPPPAPIKVCAFEAQESAEANLPNGKPASCATKAGEGARGCGCGPGLRWCYGPQTALPIQQALREQLGRSVDEVTTGARPYTDLVLAKDGWQNGTIAFWKKHLAPHYSLAQTFNVPDEAEPLPAEPDFNDQTFIKVPRPGLHAGVLTLPGYLLRFMTDRSRANRFRIDFLCSYFVPPEHLEEASTAQCSDTNPDITQRCNCRYCHAVLEPMAAHWGLFAMAGSTQMTDTSLFPKQNAACKGSNNAFCQRFYVTQPDAPNAGALLPYQFAGAHPEIIANIEGGPRLLAQQAVDTGQFAQCTVRKLWLHLDNTEIYQAGTAKTPDLDLLAEGFAAHNYDYPWLVEQLVSRPEYRKAR